MAGGARLAGRTAVGPDLDPHPGHAQRVAERRGGRAEHVGRHPAVVATTSRPATASGRSRSPYISRSTPVRSRDSSGTVTAATTTAATAPAGQAASPPITSETSATTVT